MERKGIVLLLLCVMLPATAAWAQKHELALTGGGMFASNSNFDVDPSFALQGSYAGRLLHVPLAALYFELPVAVGFETGLKNLPSAVRSADFSSVFVAPGMKLKLAPELPVSPYFAAGVGAGHFSQTVTTTSSSGTPVESKTGSTDAVAQFGGGVDMKVAPFFSLRGEVRDYYSGVPSLGFGTSGRQHNVLVTGGLVLRF